MMRRGLIDTGHVRAACSPNHSSFTPRTRLTDRPTRRNAYLALPRPLSGSAAARRAARPSCLKAAGAHMGQQQLAGDVRRGRATSRVHRRAHGTGTCRAARSVGRSRPPAPPWCCGDAPTFAGGLLDVSGSFSEGKPGLSRLSNQLMCRTCRRWCAMPLHRTKHLKGRAGRAQIGGHDDLTSMTSASEHHGAFWHFPPRRARSLKARANHATHPTPRARDSIGSVSVVITTWLSKRT